MAAQALNATFLSAGDLLRDEVRKKTDVGKKVEKYQSTGELAPDEVVEQALLAHLSLTQNKRSFETLSNCSGSGRVGYILVSSPT